MIHTKKYLEQLELICLNCKSHDNCIHDHNCKSKQVIVELINNYNAIVVENDILKFQNRISLTDDLNDDCKGREYSRKHRMNM